MDKEKLTDIKVKHINQKLKSQHDRYIQLYNLLKDFGSELQNKYDLCDCDFSENIRAYTAKTEDHIKYFSLSDGPAIETIDVGYIHLYYEDEEYRNYWDTEYIDSNYGAYSPFYRSLEHKLDEYPEPVLDLTRLDLVIKVSYGVGMNDLNFSWKKRKKELESWQKMNNCCKKIEQQLDQLISCERLATEKLYRDGLFDVDQSYQEVNIFTRDKKLNARSYVEQGDPFFAEKLDYLALFRSDLYKRDWNPDKEEFPLGEEMCYTLAAIYNKAHNPSRVISKTDFMWIEHVVEYSIRIDL